MEWQIILALVLAIPILLFPVALVWYLNMGQIYAAVKEARKRTAARERQSRALAEERPAVAEAVAKGRHEQEEPLGTRL